MGRNVFRAAAAVLFVVATVLFGAGVAKADVGGQVPSPSSCSYPAIGAFGLDGVPVHYVCVYPTEINGSRHTCVFGGVAGVITGNVGLGIFGASITLAVGVLEGICYWACPDFSVAAEPNPALTWQGSSAETTPVKRSKCVTVAPNPIVQPEPNPAPAPNAPDSTNPLDQDPNQPPPGLTPGVLPGPHVGTTR